MLKKCVVYRLADRTIIVYSFIFNDMLLGKPKHVD